MVPTPSISVSTSLVLVLTSDPRGSQMPAAVPATTSLFFHVQQGERKSLFPRILSDCIIAHHWLIYELIMGPRERDMLISQSALNLGFEVNSIQKTKLEIGEVISYRKFRMLLSEGEIDAKHRITSGHCIPLHPTPLRVCR